MVKKLMNGEIVEISYISSSGIGEKAWKLEELSELNSDRVNSGIEETLKLEEIREEKIDKIREINNKLYEDMDKFTSQEYENLGLYNEKLLAEFAEVEEQRREKLKELELFVKINYFKLDRNRKIKEKEKNKEEWRGYLRRFQEIKIDYDNLERTRERLREGWKILLSRTAKEYTSGNLYNWQEKFPEPIKQSLETIWQEKKKELYDAIIKIKQRPDWKEQFKELHRGDGCERLDLELIMDGYNGLDFSWNCSITRENCVFAASNGREMEYPWRSRNCIGYELPEDLVQKLKEVWKKRKDTVKKQKGD